MQRFLPWILAVVSGGVLALAMPGPGLWPLVVLFPGLLLEAVERGDGRWRPWVLGFLAGVVHWVVATNWVLEVMHHYGGLPFPGAVASLLGMGVILGVPWAVTVGLASRVGPPWRIWFFPVAWIAIDTLRRFPPWEFPWNDMAAVFSDVPAALGSLPVWGTAGLGWAAVALGTGIWGLLRPTRRPAAVALLIAAIGFSLVFAVIAPGATTDCDPIRIAVLQPGTTLEEKWDPAEWQEIADRVWNQTREAADAGAEIVLWPESAVPFRLDADPTYEAIVIGMAEELGIEIVLNSIAAMEGGGWANSAYLVTAAGVSEIRYDKIHLVPFGEYVPGWAEPIISDALVREVGRFSAGGSTAPLPAGTPLGMAVCYEVVFPGHAVAEVRSGAEILVSLTNDGWYGFSWAPIQHFAQVRLRAAENRRWFARAALTGISGFVNPYGEDVSRLEAGDQGLLVADLRPNRVLTPRARWGDWWAVLCAVAAVGLFLGGRARSQKRG